MYMKKKLSQANRNFDWMYKLEQYFKLHIDIDEKLLFRVTHFAKHLRGVRGSHVLEKETLPMEIMEKVDQ
mgnify:CR=1 FL=1